MLEVLRIRNLAVIDATEISFGPGLNILSGETGAGKSIVMSAIGLLLGERAQQDWIRRGCEEASVEGLFNIEGMPWLKQRLEESGYSVQDDEFLIRRTLSRSGKNRIYLNGGIATLSTLQELTQGLIDLCGQHEHQTLLKSRTQIEVLDRYGGLSEFTAEVNLLLKQLRNLEAELNSRSKWSEERSRRRDFLAFQLEEIESAQLSEGEDEVLSQEKKKLQTSEKRLQLAQATLNMLDSDSMDYPGVMSSFGGIRQKLTELQQLDADVNSVLEALDRAFLEIEDIESQLRHYGERCDLDPERLEFISSRLTLITQLKRKYGPSIQEVIAAYETLKLEYESLDSSEERLQKIRIEIKDILKELKEKAQRLSKKRRSISKVLGDSITAELRDLKMESSVFNVQIEDIDSVSDWAMDSGCNAIEFLIQTNAGESAKPLGRVASGGELSRVMLAVRRVTAHGGESGSIGVYLFDEIDSGMSGQTAFAVGRKLKAVAEYHQVICITHLPQVAAFADVHRVVRKREHSGRTMTEVLALSSDERRAEVARMLGGEAICESSLKNADDLIRQAGRSMKTEKKTKKGEKVL